MIRIGQIKVPVGTAATGEKEILIQKASNMLHIKPHQIQRLEIIRRSIDARKKPDILYIYTVDVQVTQEESVFIKTQKGRDKDKITCVRTTEYTFPHISKNIVKPKVVVAGSGPAGLFCSYYLAKSGFAPILLERGKCVEERTKDVEEFWQTGRLKPQSNVQFGEGGAGTFSDGKLNTLIKDKDGRNREVLKTLIAHGANEEILYDAKPHIGTDVLSGIVKKMRENIIAFGGSVEFEAQVTDICVKDGKVTGVEINHNRHMDCEVLVLAIGHSARDTFEMLYDRKLSMEQKAFAVGFRVEHPQSMINTSQYGMSESKVLGAAPYKVTAPTQLNRGVYSFCMCPGGYVVNASTEDGRLAVNGMSYSGRDGSNANSAIIVQVGPEDFGSEHPLAGVEFQRELERKAYALANGKIPVQRYGDFRDKVTGQEKTKDSSLAAEPPLLPACKGTYAWADLTGILPDDCNQAFVEGMEAFGRQIKGFDRPDAILSGVESRTSSPIRITRDKNMQANIRGIYPCGEGAGYAGGITSAAMDGLRVAETIAINTL